MQKFKAQDVSIKEEEGNQKGVRVMKSDAPAKPSISDFTYEKIRKSGEGDYGAIKSKYGALAATDPERSAKTQKDKRFSLSPLLRGPLSVEQEERRAIDERVKSRVLDLAKEARVQASADGYNEGLQKGYNEAYQEFKADSVNRVAKLELLLSEMERAKEDIFQANERFLIELIFRIARMVMLKDLATDKEYLQRLTKELIDRVGVRENITLRIHPDDLATMVTLKDDLENSIGSLKNLHIESSHQVKQGGCIVETEWNAIDASIETQLQGLYDSLVGGHKSGNAG